MANAAVLAWELACWPLQRALRWSAQIELSSSVTRTRAHTFYERNGYQEKRLRFVKTLA